MGLERTIKQKTYTHDFEEYKTHWNHMAQTHTRTTHAKKHVLSGSTQEKQVHREHGLNKNVQLSESLSTSLPFFVLNYASVLMTK